MCSVSKPIVKEYVASIHQSEVQTDRLQYDVSVTRPVGIIVFDKIDSKSPHSDSSSS